MKLALRIRENVETSRMSFMPPPSQRPPRGESERLAEYFTERTSNTQLPQETRGKLATLSGGRTGQVVVACGRRDPADLPFTTH